ncbi:MAG: lysophospholipid acyltransferase family protein [Flavobacteriales bacterium]|jgi:1-acyl-sn-glycerol-3-phosphate acyltransferase
MIRTLFAVVWTAVCCAAGLAVLAVRRGSGPWVLTRIGDRMWSRVLLRVVGGGQPQVTFDAELPPSAIFVGNHASLLDINAAFAALPRPIVFLSKSGVRKVPLLGAINARVGTVFVERGNPESAREAVNQLAANARSGVSVVVYPEGTRSDDGEVRAFRKGAFHLAAVSGLPVVPFFVEGTRDLLPKGALAFRRTPGIRVVVGAPLEAPESDAPEAIERVRQAAEDAVRRLGQRAAVQGARA